MQNSKHGCSTSTLLIQLMVLATKPLTGTAFWGTKIADRKKYSNSSIKNLTNRFFPQAIRLQINGNSITIVPAASYSHWLLLHVRTVHFNIHVPAQDFLKTSVTALVRKVGAWFQHVLNLKQIHTGNFVYSVLPQNVWNSYALKNPLFVTQFSNRPLRQSAS